MRRIVIDIPDLNDCFQSVALDSKQYFLRTTWNNFGQFWTFGLFTHLREPIVQGIKIVPRHPLNLQYMDDRLPSGVLGVYSKKDRISRGDFNDGSAVFAYVSNNQPS